MTALGCKLNQSEAETWARCLAAAGCDIVEHPADADLCIVNTCTVTHVAARKSRQLIRRCAHEQARAQVLVTGCFAEISPAETARLPGVTCVLGMSDKERAVENAARLLGLSQGVLPRPAAWWGLDSIEPNAEKSIPPTMPGMHTRAFVKIQDGCNNACTYCIVRIARGPQRSRSTVEILEEILDRQRQGYQEVVLTGVHIGAYGRDSGETLADLVRNILDKTCFPRLRLTSIEPWDLSPQLLRLWGDPRMCRHLHLPLQSGCDATLLRMGRRYTTAQYRDLVERASAAIPDLAVTTDVIVGFPGEDEREFAASAEFVTGIGFARIHVFPFSARPGTAAVSMPGQVSPPAKKMRARHMSSIALQSSIEFHRWFLGRTVDVLFESREEGSWSGLTDNYLRVWAGSRADLTNRILPVYVLEAAPKCLRGELTTDKPYLGGSKP